MPDLIGAARAAVEALQGAGLTAGTNTDELMPPCAWVAHDTAEIAYLDGSADVKLSLYLIAPAAGYDAELATLQELLDKALTAIDPDGPIDLSAGVATSHGTLPAFRIPLTMKG